ncbi:MAG: DUF2057 family protein [Pantoea sp.]|uniref:YccT family protein n=1 Tax=Pantoea sp. TaxID=69393 RepID=UPI000ED07FE0|nr:DUF2057 family protein [Pantoea sp.]MDU6077337.1 DUF2057 family protein [Pantoea sp.]MDU7837103.1 DUF2057 family protein [Pantoea sp.]HAB23454.1 hypothetical protein [Pantoea sp.]
MKLSLAVTGLTVLLVSATCQAITLKLDPQIDLLVLDGRKISGSLLKGADSLELERGQHQFLFRVEQLRDARKDASLRYQSAPMIVTFNAQVKTITIRLPALENRRERHHFDRTLNFQLVDERGKEIDIRRDRLPLSAESDMEKAMILYNRNGQVASVPHFAAVRDGAANLAPVEAEFVWIDEAQSPAIKRWFHRFDQATRQQFMSLVKLLRTS